MAGINVELHIGILAESFEEQLKKQGLQCKKVAEYETIRKSINTLYLLGYLTENEKTKKFQKLFKELIEEVRKENFEVINQFLHTRDKEINLADKKFESEI